MAHVLCKSHESIALQVMEALTAHTMARGGSQDLQHQAIGIAVASMDLFLCLR